MEWISFFERKPTEGQSIWYYGEYIGVWHGNYVYSVNDPVSPHLIVCAESPGLVDNMDAPWWMPYEEQERPVKPSKDYPDDYPRLITVDGKDIWTTEGRMGFYEE
jgi:hypothetical protein